MKKYTWAVAFALFVIGAAEVSAASSTLSIKAGDTVTITCQNATTPQTPVVQSPATPVVQSPAGGSVSGETRFIAFNTLYASGDNTPAGSTQIDLGGHSGTAGGTGTYLDPITLAVGGSMVNGKELDDYQYGTRFYIPALRKYFMAVDFCGDGNSPQTEPCHKSEEPGKPQLDLYAGTTNKSGVLACEDKLTGDHLMIEAPASNYVVAPGPIYNGTCAGTYGDTVVKS